MAMMAHSDETDDSHERAGMHPGCAIVPAALAVADREGADGLRFIKGVVAGYDIGCRITQALGVQNVRSRALSLHGIGTNFGSAAAAASVLGLKEELVHSSGITPRSRIPASITGCATGTTWRRLLSSPAWVPVTA